MKILLTNVPDLHVAKTTDDWDLEASDIGIFPPLGLMYLGGALRAQGRHQVKIIDCVLNKYSLNQIATIALEYQPDIVGMTCYTPTLYDIIRLSAKFREVLPGATIVWGGPHTLLFPMESMVHPEVDILVLGEGEEVFPALCNALEDKKPFEAIPGLVYRDNGEVRRTGDPGYMRTIDDIPFPTFDLLDYRRYYSAVGTGQPVGTICSSRGCPFHCTFCCKPYSTYRSRSAQNILDEMSEYHAHGIREFFFFDDLFNATPERVIEISQGILDRKLKVNWSFRGRVDAVTQEMLRLAKKAGCRQIFYGVEAATNEGLKEIRKNITIEQARQAVRWTNKAGILSSTNWIIGFPHHRTRQDILDLIDVAVSINSDFAQFNICIAYHGTQIFEAGVRAGLFEPELWRNFASSPIPNFVEPIWDKNLSRQELSELLRLCYKRFYFRPVPILRKLLRVRRMAELKLFAKGAMTLLGIGGYHRKKHVEGVGL
jgi:radical SAM superfamily enzyme YgiQ (UPF0313 family)